jgi:hypothetical protein
MEKSHQMGKYSELQKDKDGTKIDGARDLDFYYLIYFVKGKIVISFSSIRGKTQPIILAFTLLVAVAASPITIANDSSFAPARRPHHCDARRLLVP